MRCRNCGWENNGAETKCQKCNAPLSGGGAEERISSHPEEASYERLNLSRTAREEDVFHVIEQQEHENVCGKCGYSLRPNESVCPNCNASYGTTGKERPATMPDHLGGGKKPENKPLYKGTVNPWENVTSSPSCLLTVLPRENEKEVLPVLKFSGNEILLNRENTEPANQTITSKVQARLVYEDNKWFVEDHSSMKTTYIHVGEKREIKDGDIILLGNRLFRFEL